MRAIFSEKNASHCCKRERSKHDSANGFCKKLLIELNELPAQSGDGAQSTQQPEEPKLMKYVLNLVVLLTLLTNYGFSFVSWDGYLFVNSDGTARHKRNGEIIFVCDRSDVKIIDGHLIVESYSGTGVDIEVNAATAQAIVNEFRRDTDSRRRRRDGNETYIRPIPVVPNPNDSL